MNKRERMAWHKSHFGPINDLKAIDDFSEKFVFVKVHKALGEAETIDDDIIYRSACGVWRLNIEKCRNANYVLALDCGIVVGIYKVDSSRWSKVDDTNLAGIYGRNNGIHEKIVRLSECGGNYPKRVYFVKKDGECGPHVKCLLGKKIYYESNEKFLKTQGAHYSFNIN